MTRFLLSAVAVCVLCVSLTGSAAAGSKTRQSWVTASGVAVEQKVSQSGSGKSTKNEFKMTAPNGATLQQKVKQNSHGTSVQVKVKRPDGSSYKAKYKN